MASPFFTEVTLDDLMRVVISKLLEIEERVVASRGSTRELRGVMLELRNPRARLSRTETRGKPISCIGELCWYLAGSNELDFIKYYIPQYIKNSDDDILHGAYGPRLFDWDGIDQVARVINILESRPTSRQATIQVFDRHDLTYKYKDVPCTCTFQFMVRSDQLNMITYMRSNDAYLGLTHDIFCFSMLQEVIARSLSIEIGSYRHVVGSLHLYDKHEYSARAFLTEGWQSTDVEMPPMPMDDPWPEISNLLMFEASIRNNESLDDALLQETTPYWADLIRLLIVFRLFKDEDSTGIELIRDKLHSPVYSSFVNAKLQQLAGA